MLKIPPPGNNRSHLMGEWLRHCDGSRAIRQMFMISRTRSAAAQKAAALRV